MKFINRVEKFINKEQNPTIKEEFHFTNTEQD